MPEFILNQMAVHAFLVSACYIYVATSSLVICILLVICIIHTHIPGIDIAIDEDIGVGVTVEDAVVVIPGGKHPASSISEQQSPKL